VTFKS
jgi:exportin-7